MARKQKLKFKPTPISRLLKYKVPLKMVGDPEWSTGGNQWRAWQNRQRAVYEDMLIIKRGGWTDGMYQLADKENRQLDVLIDRKWEDHDRAWEDHKFYDYEQAVMDNATWDYEHDNFLDVA